MIEAKDLENEQLTVSLNRQITSNATKAAAFGYEYSEDNN